MTYEEAVEYLDKLKAGSIRLGLDRVRRLLSRLGDPQNDLFAIHIAGTNGKGSVAAMISSIVEASGRRVGLFTSPHLNDFRERIRINFSPIPEDKLSRLVAEMAPVAREIAGDGDEHPTYFEFITAIAIRYFADEKVDAGVFEVGLGGRLDATNILQSKIQVITNIGIDHGSYLGQTIEDITREKAGIIEEGGSVVASDGPEEALQVIDRICSSRGALLYRVGTDIHYEISAFDLELQSVDIQTWRGDYPKARIALLGDYQAANAAVAVGAAECIRQAGMEISDEAIREGLLRTRWPGRFEVLMKEPVVVLDGAHNPLGAASLARSLRNYFHGKRIDLILGVLKDKDYFSICSHLVPLAGRVLISPVGDDRSLSPHELCLACSEASPKKKVFSMESFEDALGFSLSGKPDVICVTGSLYLVGQAREVILAIR